MSEKIKGRFAPSPSGRMHLGNIFSALMSWLSAKSQGGTWLLRIEDLDTQRCKMDYALQLEDDLRWLGLEWDEGGTQCKGGNKPYMQSLRGDIYEKCLQRLNNLNLTYRCKCTRADILASNAPHENDGRVVYKGTCRPPYIAEKEPVDVKHSLEGVGAVRLYVPNKDVSFIDGHYGHQSVNLASHCGDFIIRRRDDAWAYQLAVVIDDALMGVTEVVRGRDLLLSAPQQIYLYDLLGFQAPKFTHHPLICNDDMQRLSKRDKSLDIGELRKYYSAEELIGRLAYGIGLTPNPSAISAKELISVFEWRKIPRENVILHI